MWVFCLYTVTSLEVCILLHVLVNPCMKRLNGIVCLWYYGVSVQETTFFWKELGILRLMLVSQVAELISPMLER